MAAATDQHTGNTMDVARTSRLPGFSNWSRRDRLIGSWHGLAGPSRSIIGRQGNTEVHVSRCFDRLRMCCWSRNATPSLNCACTCCCDKVTAPTRWCWLSLCDSCCWLLNCSVSWQQFVGQRREPVHISAVIDFFLRSSWILPPCG